MNIGGVGSSQTTGLVRPFIPLEKGTVETFAKEMTRRAEQTALPENATRTVDAEGLGKAMTNAVDYIDENFGDQAARTVMGIVLNRVGDGAITEDSLGQGFVDALEFVDRNFGIASGDRAMSNFNGELNNALNGYFQNGKDESFLAQDLDTATQNLGQAMGDAIGSVMKKFSEGAKGPSLMDSALEDMKQSLDEAGQEKNTTIADEMAAKAVDENGFPVDQSQDPGVAATTDSTGQDGTAVAPDVQASQAGSAASSGQRLRRRRIASSNPYEKSGLSAGSVLNVSV